MNNNTVYYSIINKKVLGNKSQTMQARVLLKEMLNYFNLKMPEIIILTNGKPIFKNSNIYFNYSHSKNYIACAVSLCNVGIDIEETSRTIDDAISKKYLDNVKSQSKRLESWVKKEAYSKLKGLGIQIGIQNIKLDEIKEKNYFINKKECMCAIYTTNDNIEFKELNFY